MYSPPRGPLFQSSVPPKRDCNAVALHDAVAWVAFQSSVPPKRDCNEQYRATRTSQERFNPQSLRRGTATRQLVVRRVTHSVSILSPSEEGLQHVEPAARPSPEPVSILSPSEEGLQRDGRPRLHGPLGFNPQSLRRGTATVVSAIGSSREGLFQSSVPPKRDCNTGSGMSGSAGGRFQSSVPPKRDCNCRSAFALALEPRFQSSVPPKRDCNRRPACSSCPCASFNPQSLRRGTATTLRVDGNEIVLKFQSSVPPKRDCN